MFLYLINYYVKIVPFKCQHFKRNMKCCIYNSSDVVRTRRPVKVIVMKTKNILSNFLDSSAEFLVCRSAISSFVPFSPAC